MTDKRKRPRDVSQRAKLIVDIATGEVEDNESNDKNPPTQNNKERKETED